MLTNNDEILKSSSDTNMNLLEEGVFYIEEISDNPCEPQAIEQTINTIDPAILPDDLSLTDMKIFDNNTPSKEDHHINFSSEIDETQIFSQVNFGGDILDYFHSNYLNKA